MKNKRIIWFISTGLIALLPFFIKYLFNMAFSTNFQLKDIFVNGELFAINTVICFGCLLDLFLHKEESIDVRRGYYSTILLVTGFVSSLLYGVIILITNIGVDGHINIQTIIYIQIITYLLTIIFGSVSRQFT